MNKSIDHPKTVFVISPIGSPGTAEHRRYQLALDYIVKKALCEPEWRVIRADSEESPDSIGTKVIERILESDLTIANLTDQNPNVFYELAVAHGYKRPVIHMMESGQKIPFDVSDQRAIFYDLSDPESVDQAKDRLLAAARYLEGSDEEARNPLSQYAAFKSISSASSTDAGSAVVDALQGMSSSISRLANRIEFLEGASGRGYYRVAGEIPNVLSERDLEKDLQRIADQLAFLEADDSSPAAQKRRVMRSLHFERDRLLEEAAKNRARARRLALKEGRSDGNARDLPTG